MLASSASLTRQGGEGYVSRAVGPLSLYSIQLPLSVRLIYFFTRCELVEVTEDFEYCNLFSASKWTSSVQKDLTPESETSWINIISLVSRLPLSIATKQLPKRLASLASLHPSHAPPTLCLTLHLRPRL